MNFKERYKAVMKQQRIYPAVRISSKAERAVKGGHPWVYGEEITSEDADIRDGCIVDVFAGNAWQGLKDPAGRDRDSIIPIPRSGSALYPVTAMTVLKMHSGSDA